MKYTKANRETAIERLREVFPKGSTAYTQLLDVSASGMTRWIQVLKISRNRPSYWGGYVNIVLDYAQSERHGSRCVKVGGCGMDMGFHLIFTLSSILHGDGYAIKHEWL